jgi:hypothetical protein
MPRRKPKKDELPSTPKRGTGATAFVPQADGGEGLRSTLFGPKGSRHGALAGRGITSRGLGGGNATVERAEGVGKKGGRRGFTPSPFQPGPNVPGSSAAPITAPPGAPAVSGPGTLKPETGGRGSPKHAGGSSGSGKRKRGGGG